MADEKTRGWGEGIVPTGFGPIGGVSSSEMTSPVAGVVPVKEAVAKGWAYTMPPSCGSLYVPVREHASGITGHHNGTNFDVPVNFHGVANPSVFKLCTLT